MKKLTLTSLVVCAAMLPVLSHAADGEKDRTSPVTYVKDSAITAKIKAKLAAEKLSSLATIHVDTDASGMVYLSGTARSQEQIDKAVSIAKSTDRVTGVKNDLKVKSDS